MLKYLINDSAKAFEPWHEGSESMSYFTSNEDATKMAIYDLEHRGLKKLVSFPFSSVFELTAAYLEIFQNYFNLSFSVLSHATQNVHLGALKVTGIEFLNRESMFREIQRKSREEKADTPHVFLIPPNLAKMLSLVVLLTNKQAIYCAVKCFILTPYSF